ncbi:MAG TPA: triphosphoribosyl-dephospho-CoA synthase, partial [Bacillota bacterium]|nr:triphosphoribosyl-dephospho-CoA synthase [Bacillota bacterium]
DLGLRIISLAQAKKASGDIHGTHRGGRALAEALSGYPAAFKAAGLMELASPHRALCSIMAELDDSNLLFRGGEEALAFIKSEAERLLNLSDDCMIRELSNLDSICIERNISPGGAADMFALSVLIFRLKASQ